MSRARRGQQGLDFTQGGWLELAGEPGQVYLPGGRGHFEHALVPEGGQAHQRIQLAPAVFAATPATPAAQPKAGGRFVDYEPFAATEAAPRKVCVWLPPGYDAGKERYAVLYMHDGQNLFDPADSVQWGAWGVDRHLVELARQNKVRPTIVVGVWNMRENRGREYLPQAPVMSLPADWRGEVAAPNSDGASAPLSDAYLRFLVKELKPFVDANFRTRSCRADTFVMGASMGGLISLYALASYPEVFGGVGCVSTHWPMTTNGKLMQPSLDPKVDQIAQDHAALPGHGAQRDGVARAAGDTAGVPAQAGLSLQARINSPGLFIGGGRRAKKSPLQGAG